MGPQMLLNMPGEGQLSWRTSVNKQTKNAGKTQNRVVDRFIGHRADLRGEGDTKPAYHFKRMDGHAEENMGVVVIEEVKGGDDLYRVTRERYWINCLGTYNEENRRK